MKKSLNLFSLSLLLLSLTGCFATFGLNDMNSKSYQECWVASDVQDTIIAIGKPAKPVQGYENALVLAGQRHNYLIEPVSQQGKNDLKRIFETVDLRYLRVNLPEEKHIAVKETGNEAAGEYYRCPSAFGCAWDIDLWYEKPLSPTSEKEQKHLKNSGFNCIKREKENELFCWYHTYKVAFTPTQKPATSKTLTHRFKQPVPIVRYEFHADKGATGRTVRNALIPLAVVFDIVTFPVQVQMWNPKK